MCSSGAGKQEGDIQWCQHRENKQLFGFWAYFCEKPFIRLTLHVTASQLIAYMSKDLQITKIKESSGGFPQESID